MATVAQQYQRSARKQHWSTLEAVGVLRVAIKVWAKVNGDAIHVLVDVNGYTAEGTPTEYFHPTTVGSPFVPFLR